MRPIVEMQFADFSSIAFNQIVNQAATLYWRTQVPCPIVVRLPSGGTAGSGPFHSEHGIQLYAHYPGLIVLTPATVGDAYSMLLEAVALDDPVIFCEHKFLYYHLKADALPRASAHRQGTHCPQRRTRHAGDLQRDAGPKPSRSRRTGPRRISNRNRRPPVSEASRHG